MTRDYEKKSSEEPKRSFNEKPSVDDSAMMKKLEDYCFYLEKDNSQAIKSSNKNEVGNSNGFKDSGFSLSLYDVENDAMKTSDQSDLNS